MSHTVTFNNLTILTLSYAEYFISVPIHKIGIFGFGQNRGDLERGLVIQFDLPAALPHGEDVDVGVEAEAERLALVPHRGQNLPRVVVPGPHDPTRVRCAWV